MNSLPQCAKCNVLLCRTKPLEELDRKWLPENCPMKSDTQTIQSIIDRYALEEVKKIYISAAIIEKEGWKK